MDPLGAVYLKKAGTGSAVVFDKTENKLDKWIDATATKAKDNIESDLHRMGGVWEQDIPELTTRFEDYQNTLKNYEKEKNAAAKAQLYRDVIRKGVEFETYTNKSKTNKQQYFTKSQAIANDKGAFFAADAQQQLDAWKNKPVTERPDDMGIEMPKNIDPAKAFAEKMKTSLGKPNTEAVEVIEGGKRVKKNQNFYTNEDIETAKSRSYAQLPQNYINVEKAKIMEQAADKKDEYGNSIYNIDERTEATAALAQMKANPTSVDDLIKSRLFKYVQPSLESQGIAIRPYIPPKGATGAGGGKDKYDVATGTTMMVNTVGGANQGQEQNWIVTAQKKGGPNPVVDWTVGTTQLKEIADATNNQDLKNDLADLKSKNQQYVTMTGTLKHIGRNSSGDYIMIVPKTALGKYDMAQKPVVIPLTSENEATLMSMYNSQNPKALLDQAQQQYGTTTKEVTPKTPPTLKVKSKATPPAESKPNRWEKNKRKKS
jgi:hypothetical protein